MMYANLFSSAFTALGLLVTLEIVDVLAYFERNPSILPHMFIMAVCSAIGQVRGASGDDCRRHASQRLRPLAAGATLRLRLLATRHAAAARCGCGR